MNVCRVICINKKIYFENFNVLYQKSRVLYNIVINQIKNVQRRSCSRNVEARCGSGGDGASGVTSFVISKVKVERDPAGSHPALLARLEENRQDAARKEAEVLERWVADSYVRHKLLNKMDHRSERHRPTCLCDLLSSYIEKGLRPGVGCHMVNQSVYPSSNLNGFCLK